MLVGALLPWNTGRAAAVLPPSSGPARVIHGIALVLGVMALLVGARRLYDSEAHRGVERLPLIAGLLEGFLFLVQYFIVTFRLAQLVASRRLPHIPLTPIALRGTIGAWVAGIGALCAIVGGLAVRRLDSGTATTGSESI